MKVVILIGIIFVFIACIFPPRRIYYGDDAFLGKYGFLFTLPGSVYQSLDLKILITEVLVIVALTGAVLVLVRSLK